jgi:tetratricopeptide (TPR) repeat protein
MQQKLLSFLLFVSVAIAGRAQFLTTLPSGGNTKATVGEQVGLTQINIQYNRPAVKGREGKVWGQLVPDGFVNLGFGSAPSSPWRAGANENTTISFSTDVSIEGKPLSAGTYGFFIAPAGDGATLIFSKNNHSWGAYFYDPKEDALRVDIKSVVLTESVERLKYEFSDQQEASAVIALLWEKKKFPFKVEVDYVKTQLDTYRRELQGNLAFRAEAWTEAVNFCVQRKVNLEEALRWSDNALSPSFGGQKNFATLSAKAGVLGALGRTSEQEALMKEALPMGTMQEVHTYGRSLIAAQKPKLALEVLQANARKFPNVFMTTMGLVRAYSANGDFASALKSAQTALTLAPNQANKEAVEGFIRALQSGKDIN